MIYKKFAAVYDALMKDAPYDKWVRFVDTKRKQYQVAGRKLLDLGCGTGELSVRLAKKGYQVDGVDFSAEMLAIARSKALEQSLNIAFYQQDMTELELIEKYDIIGIFCDSLNYLASPEKVFRTFVNVRQYLNDQGLFIFDVHSVYKVNHIFLNQTFTYDQGDICYIWNCLPGTEPNSVEHDLTFFVERPDGTYDRFDEWHTQRTFPVDTYVAWLHEAGFEILEISGDFLDPPLRLNAERIFFTARKKK